MVSTSGEETNMKNTMRNVMQAGAALSLVAIGYILGVTGFANPGVLRAQEAEAEPAPGDTPAMGPSKEAQDQIRAAFEALSAAMQSLEQEKLYVPATRGVNSFAVIAGGINAIEDLEMNRGVDPETFAGLYAGMAVDGVAEHLARDDEGRVTYKNKVVRMYSISRLKQLFAKRAQMSGEAAPETGTQP
jgi:hypothetical protein